MILESGKFYRQRDGRKAYVGCVGNPLDAECPYPALGWSAGGFPDEWQINGRMCNHEQERDLVAEWTE